VVAAAAVDKNNLDKSIDIIISRQSRRTIIEVNQRFTVPCDEWSQNMQ
jgi:hypothetical protein